MKRLTTLFLILCLLLPLSVAAADLVWEPNDDFYDQHRDACEPVYETQRAAQEIAVWQDPETDTVLWTLDEGDEVYVYQSYKDSRRIVWGLIEKEEYGRTGWIPLGLTIVPYSQRQFMEDNRTRVKTYGDTPPACENACFYTYPNSGEYVIRSVGSSTSYDFYYVDKDGRAWARYDPPSYDSYTWVCADDPANTELPVYSGDTPYKGGPVEKLFRDTDDGDDGDDGERTRGDATWVWALGAVVLVIAIAAVVLALVFRKKKRA